MSEEQLHALYQQLDDKDDDINKHTQTIARLRQQLEEQEEMLRTARLEAETSLADVAQLQVMSVVRIHPVITSGISCWFWWFWNLNVKYFISFRLYFVLFGNILP